MAQSIPRQDDVLIKNAELNGMLADVRVGTKIKQIGVNLDAPGAQCIDAQGNALLPGLHDHHLHLYAIALADLSMDCSRLTQRNVQGLADELGKQPGQGWIRGVLYHESIAGDLDRSALDELCGERPVRLQHSSGKLWIVNSQAIQLLGLESVRNQPGLERDDTGRVSGRMWRMDDWLQARLAEGAGAQQGMPELRSLSLRLAQWGITGVTDASFTNNAARLDGFETARQRGELLQRVYPMGEESLDAVPLKILLDEDDLPDLDELTRCVRRAGEQSRVVAFHCVSHIELLVALAALDEAGVDVQARIEHAGVVRPEVVPGLLASGATVVTQPGFIGQRGERFRRMADAADVDYLYPYGSLLAAGVPVAASSDAPYGPLNPWLIMASAVSRRTETGRALNRKECVPAVEALRGYLSAPENPGGPARKIKVGAPADLCILDRTLQQALSSIDAVQVRYTLIDGQLVYAKSPNTSSVCSPK